MLLSATLTASLFFSVQAAPVVTNVTPVEPQEAKDSNERICKRTAVIGSRMKKRVCATRAEWDALAEESRYKAANLQRRGQVPGESPGT